MKPTKKQLENAGFSQAAYQRNTPPNMEDQVDRLVKKTWDKFQQTPRSKRLMIAVSGIPGSGEYLLHRRVILVDSRAHS